MTSLEKLARTQPGSAWKIEQLDRAFNTMSVQDVAMALPSKKFECNLLMAKYVDDHKAHVKAVYQLRVKALNVRLIHDWPNPRGSDRYGNMANLCIGEVVGDSLCPQCYGRRQLWGKHNQITVCHVCEGAGRKSLSWADRAEYMEIEKDEWWQWRKITDEVFRIAQNAMSSAEGYFINRINEK